MSGGCLEGVWKVYEGSGGCLDGVWWLSARFHLGLCKITLRCLNGVCKVSTGFRSGHIIKNCLGPKFSWTQHFLEPKIFLTKNYLTQSL